MLNRQNKPLLFLLLALLLYFPAYLINLGDQPMIEDESIRSLVAFEMVKSGDYITPTIGGEPYLKKPPLYNWLIVASFKLFNNYSEVTIRIPMILSIFFFGITIFFFVRKELGTKMGAINALIFITVGRIIMYESLHGLIDITFSWLTYIFFMLSYLLMKKKRYLLLFITAYLITSVTYLMKGLPSIVFLGISLLVLFISHKKFKMLFNWRHFVGILIFIVIVGGYYYIYFIRNNIQPESVFATLLGETTRRTVIRFGWFRTVKHLFTFPFEMIYHFLPWTILTAVLFIKGQFKKLKTHPFLMYNLLLLIFNVILYWTSPEVFPRYLLMLVPLYFTMVSWIYFEYRKENLLLTKLIDYILGGTLILFSIAPFAAMFNDVIKNFNNILLISIILSAILIILSYLYWKTIKYRLFWLAIAILVLRIGFDFTIIPTRQFNSLEVVSIREAKTLAEETSGRQLFSYWNPDFEPDHYYQKRILLTRFNYHLSIARDEILYVNSEKIPGALYMALEKHIVDQNDYIQHGVVDQVVDGAQLLPLIEFNDP